MSEERRKVSPSTYATSPQRRMSHLKIDRARDAIPGHEENVRMAPKSSVINDCVRYINALESAIERNGIPQPVFYPAHHCTHIQKTGFQKPSSHTWGPNCSVCGRLTEVPCQYDPDGPEQRFVTSAGEPTSLQYPPLPSNPNYPQYNFNQSSSSTSFA